MAEIVQPEGQTDEFADVRNSEFLLFVEIEHNVHIKLVPFRLDIDQLPRLDLDGWHRLRNCEEEMDNE